VKYLGIGHTYIRRTGNCSGRNCLLFIIYFYFYFIFSNIITGSFVIFMTFEIECTIIEFYQYLKSVQGDTPLVVVEFTYDILWGAVVVAAA
jgi:hypothetical protein